MDYIFLLIISCELLHEKSQKQEFLEKVPLAKGDLERYS